MRWCLRTIHSAGSEVWGYSGDQPIPALKLNHRVSKGLACSLLCLIVLWQGSRQPQPPASLRQVLYQRGTYSNSFFPTSFSIPYPLSPSLTTQVNFALSTWKIAVSFTEGHGAPHLLRICKSFAVAEPCFHGGWCRGKAASHTPASFIGRR